MSLITIQIAKGTSHTQTVHCSAGENLLKVLKENNIFIENPCNGKGICGKCKVRILSGRCNKVSQTELQFLREAEIAQGFRLSCLTEVEGDVKIELLEKKRKHHILTSGYLPEFEKEYLREGYGIALDIGTTTVAMALIDLTTGEEATQASAVNAQKQYGLDVLTRITYEYEHPEEGIQTLQKTIVASLNEMIETLCRQAEISGEQIKEIVVAANCTMTHMLLGVDARSIGKSPYQPVFTEARSVLAKEIGILAGEDTTVYCLPHVSSYIGADVVAGAYVCDLQSRKKNVLFIDIGTNGEIVLSKAGKLFCCSCAAGPALEGMNISSGMRAGEGAVEDLLISENGIDLKVIGDGTPEGLCGSGILAAIKELLRIKVIKKTGVFIKKETLSDTDFRHPYLRMHGKKRQFLLHASPEIFVTQNDVRQVQLAKGAIFSGCLVLLKTAGIMLRELDEVLIAGQFGSHLPADSLIGTGILPEEVREKLTYVGNSSKTGAYMALLSRTVRREMEELSLTMEYIELAETENYERIFAESMLFPECK